MDGNANSSWSLGIIAPFLAPCLSMFRSVLICLYVGEGQYRTVSHGFREGPIFLPRLTPVRERQYRTVSPGRAFGVREGPSSFRGRTQAVEPKTAGFSVQCPPSFLVVPRTSGLIVN